MGPRGDSTGYRVRGTGYALVNGPEPGVPYPLPDWVSRSPFEKSPQLPATRRMSQLAQRLGFDLTDALARDGEILADLFQRVLAAIADTKAHLDHLLLARRQRFQHRFGLLLQIEVDDRLRWRHRRS